MADETPIVAQSADGLLHQFPAGTDASVVDTVMRRYAEATAPAAPEPESGTLLGVARAVKQEAASIPGRLEHALGTYYQGTATGAQALAAADQDAVRRKIDVLDRVDRGETIKPKSSAGLGGMRADPELELANAYAARSDDGRAAMRKQIEAEVAALPPVEQTALGKAAGMVKELGAAVSAKGTESEEAARKSFPLTPEEESRSSVKITKMIVGLTPFVAASALGGLPGLMGYAGLEGYSSTYDAAKQKGASDEDAAAAGLFNGLAQAGIMSVPVGKAMEILQALPTQMKGKFLGAVATAAKTGLGQTALAGVGGAGAMLGYTQLSTLAENVVARSTYDPSRAPTEGMGVDLPEAAAAGALLPVLGRGGAAVLRRLRPKPEDVAKKVMDTGTVDEAIDAAKSVVDATPVDVETVAAQAREYGGPAEQQQGKLLQLFGGLNRGTVEQAADGGFHFRTGEGEDAPTHPLKVWDETVKRADGAEPTIDPKLAAAQREHYGKLGIDIVYFENDAQIPFDGAVAPSQPNTIFLSNNPQRNAAQVAAHEVTHVLESTILPDGTNLGDVLHSQITEGLTNQGLRHAYETFGKTAPERAAFPAGPEGDSAHADAVVSHLVRELGADIGGEAPRFQTFVPKVIDAVEARYGLDAAKDVLKKLIDGLQNAMRTLRTFFARPEEHAEFGQPDTVSQNWVTNLGEVHDTLAKMYAERFGTQAEKENSALATMRDTAQRDRFARESPESGASAGKRRTSEDYVVRSDMSREGEEIPVRALRDENGQVTHVVPENAPVAEVWPNLRGKSAEEIIAAMYGDHAQGAAPDPSRVRRADEPVTAPASEAKPESITPEAQRPAIEEAHQRIVRMRRWLSELDAKRRADAESSPHATLLKQTEAAILAKVRGVEERLTAAQAVRLEKVRADLDALLNPTGDSPDMARVREALTKEQQKLADAAAARLPEREQPTPEPAPAPESTPLEAARPAEPAVPEPAPQTPPPATAEVVPFKAPERPPESESVPLLMAAESPKFSPKPDEPFYSALTRGVEGLRMEKATPGQWEATIRNMPGVKAEERAWVGVDDWLRKQTKSVTKAEVLDYLREHEVRLEEVEKGGPPNFDYDGLPTGAGNRQPTKFDTYVLPGGKNYREMLLRLPPKENIKDVPPNWRVEKVSEGSFRVMEPGTDAPLGYGSTRGEAIQQALAENGIAHPDAREWHKSSHWDETNVLAHVRFDDRTGPNGEKVLHLAEVQSDWHQKGRKEGYLTPGRNEPGGVPDAPFKTTWPELALKRMLRYAAENGYDRLSWDAGATNADRYDLSKKVRELTYTGSDKLIATGLKGETLINEVVEPEKLPDYIGKEAAEKLLAQKPKRTSGDVDYNTRHLFGPDLKLGGEGMAAFYDKQLPIIANKIGKRFGAKVESIKLDTADQKALDAATRSGDSTAIGDAFRTEPAHSIAITPAMREGVMQGQPLFSPKLTGESRDRHANPDREYTPEQQRFLERQRATTTATWGDWWTKITDKPLTRLTVETVDRYAGIKKRDPEGYIAQRIANSSEGAKLVWLTEGTLAINGKAYDLGDRNGGARELLQPLKREVYDFFFWIASHRAEELAKEDREHRFTPEDIATGKTLNRGQLDFDYTLSNGKVTRSREAAYADSLGKLNVLNQSVLDIAVKGGLLTRDVADVLIKNQFYVPFFRERADGTAEFVGPQNSSGMAKQTFGKKLTGGAEKLNSDLVQNWVDNASHIIDAVAKNRAAHMTLEAGVTDGFATKLTEQQYNHLSDKQQKAESTWVMVDGKKQYYHVEDPMLFKAVGTLAALADPFYALSAARVARRVLQVGVTHNPVFAVRNLTRDSLQALAVTPQSANVFNTIATGIRDSDTLGALTNQARAAAGRELANRNLSDDAVRLLAGGGMMRIASLSDTGVSKAKLGSLLDTSEKIGGFLDGVGKAMHAYSDLVGAGEGYNRIALYKTLREQGVPHDIASFSAQDLTDFNLSGANAIVRYIRETVPFTNARAQGLYKVGRALSGSDAAMFKELDASAAAPSAKSAAAVTLLRTAGTLMGLTVVTMALDALYDKDPEYQARTEYDRGNYWFFRIGEQRFRIPMPFEVGALARIAADTGLLFFDSKMTLNRWASNTWSSMQNNLGFDFIPQVVKPIYDIKTNTSGTGQAVEPKGLEHLRPDQRYTINSTMAARGASSVINSMLRALPGQGTVEGPSPIVLDYLTKAYGGWLASSSMGMADTVIRSFTSEPVRPATDTWAGVTQGMVETSPRSQSRYVDALYQQAKGVEQAYATYRDLLQRGQAEEAQRFFTDNKDALQKHGLVSGVMRLEGDLNRQIRMITNNPDPRVTAEQKRVQIMQLQAIKSRAAEQVFGARP